jgi:hypothetical protein
VKQLCIVLLVSISLSVAARGARASYQHEFSVKAYEEFHDVLHPLQHEALPKGDFATIRARSMELVKHGKAIVKVGVPKSVPTDRVADFKKRLAIFNKTLTQFRKDAKAGSDAQLKTSYSAVHEEFEELANLVR